MRMDPCETDRFSAIEDASFAFKAADLHTLRVGYVLARDRIRHEDFAAGLEAALARPVRLLRYARYADLSEAMVQGFIDLGWLPPAVYVGARRAGSVRAVAVVERAGADRYRSALLARPGAVPSYRELRGARAAWVDPWSAAGYLMPRGLIAAQGLDPSRVLSSERFCGSYDAALDALVARTADLTGGFCSVDGSGEITHRSWSTAVSVRVLEVSPPIPSDVLCTTASLAAPESASIERALLGPGGAHVAAALGGSGLAPSDPAHYDALERAITRPR